MISNRDLLDLISSFTSLLYLLATTGGKIYYTEVRLSSIINDFVFNEKVRNLDIIQHYTAYN